VVAASMDVVAAAMDVPVVAEAVGGASTTAGRTWIVKGPCRGRFSYRRRLERGRLGAAHLSRGDWDKGLT
jgi:hypothetical protein